MKRAMNKIASRMRGSCIRKDSGENQSNVTPPRPTDTDEAFIRLPHIDSHSRSDPTPDDLAIVSPRTRQVDESTIESDLESQQLRSTQRPKQSENSHDPVEVDVPPEVLDQGITGADLGLPLFDGTSLDPKDYLINLDSDSMEKYPDVRIYFWRVGLALECGDKVVVEQLSDYQERLARDDALVKTGREHLRQSRIRREGFYLSSNRVSDRVLLADNQPGQPWYRLPTVKIASQLAWGDLKAQDDEGGYLGDRGYAWHEGEMLKTNIRVPVFWDTIFKSGIESGTVRWYASMSVQYYDCNHPIQKVHDTRLEVIGGILACIAGSGDHYPCEHSETGPILTSIWPDLFEEAKENEEEEEEEELTPAELERLQKHLGNVEDFLYGKKEYRQKKKFLGITIG